METEIKMNTQKQQVVPFMPKSEPRRIGQILVKNGKLSSESVDRISRLQETERMRFGELALKLGLVTEEDIWDAVTEQFDNDYVRCPDNALDLPHAPYSPQMEAVAQLRNQLMLQWLTDKRKVLAVVSPDVQDGRTRLVLKLAASFAQRKLKTLIIDADLNKPDQHLLFGQDRDPGLTDILQGNTNEHAITKVSDSDPLYLLPAGSDCEDSLELLSRTRMNKILFRMVADFDVVLIDTSPASTGAEGQAVAAWARSALIVARNNRTRVSRIAQLKKGLAMTQCALLGAVFNEC